MSDTTADEYRIVTQNTEERLSEKELIDHRTEMEAFTRWLDTVGKEPTNAEGYAYDTIRATIHRIDQFYRWIWDREGGYIAPPTHEDADRYIAELLPRTEATTPKRRDERSLGFSS